MRILFTKHEARSTKGSLSILKSQLSKVFSTVTLRSEEVKSETLARLVTSLLRPSGKGNSSCGLPGNFKSTRVGEYRRYSIGVTVRYSDFE